MFVHLSRPRSGLSLALSEDLQAIAMKAVGAGSHSDMCVAVETYNAEKRTLRFLFAGPKGPKPLDTNLVYRYFGESASGDASIRARWEDEHSKFYPEHGVVAVEAAKFEFRPKDNTLTLHLPPLDKCPPAIHRNRPTKDELAKRTEDAERAIAGAARLAVVTVAIPGMSEQRFAVTNTDAFELALSLTRKYPS